MSTHDATGQNTGIPRIIGKAPDGSDICAVTLDNGTLRATVMTWGASLTALYLDGLTPSLVLGSDDPDAYRTAMRYFGTVVGPVANRIAGGRFTLGDAHCETDRNEAGETTLHGGATGFGERNWRLEDSDATHCTLSLSQAHGQGGFPGKLRVRVHYALDAATLSVTIDGDTDRLTVFNPAFHAYWNLDGTATLANHRLTVHADRYLPVDARLIPTGAPAAVDGTAFDYRDAREPDVELDHNFCTGDARGPLREVCRVRAANLTLTVESGEPGLQIYTAGGLDTAPYAGHGGEPYGRHAGIAIEPQCWPDSPNHPEYPDCRLMPGAPYRQETCFRLHKT